MKLYEPLTFLLISVLIVGVGGTLFDSLLTKHQRDCHQANERLLANDELGPIQRC